MGKNWYVVIRCWSHCNRSMLECSCSYKGSFFVGNLSYVTSTRQKLGWFSPLLHISGTAQIRVQIYVRFNLRLLLLVLQH